MVSTYHAESLRGYQHRLNDSVKQIFFICYNSRQLSKPTQYKAKFFCAPSFYYCNEYNAYCWSWHIMVINKQMYVRLKDVIFTNVSRECLTKFTFINYHVNLLSYSIPWDIAATKYSVMSPLSEPFYAPTSYIHGVNMCLWLPNVWLVLFQ